MTERIESELRAWKETARQYANNEAYYRGIVIEVGRLLGNDAYISDDGSIQDEVLAEKVPQLVEKLVIKQQSQPQPKPAPKPRLIEAVEPLLKRCSDMAKNDGVCGCEQDHICGLPEFCREIDKVRLALAAERKRAVLVDAVIQATRSQLSPDIMDAPCGCPCCKAIAELDAFDKGAENG